MFFSYFKKLHAVTFCDVQKRTRERDWSCIFGIRERRSIWVKILDNVGPCESWTGLGRNIIKYFFRKFDLCQFLILFHSQNGSFLILPCLPIARPLLITAYCISNCCQLLPRQICGQSYKGSIVNFSDGIMNVQLPIVRI